MIYGARANHRPHGTVLTKPVVAETMLNLLAYTPERNLSQISVLDPCGGEGVFICLCIERLAASADTHGFSFAKAYKQLKVVELDINMLEILSHNIQATLRRLGKLRAVKDWKTILVPGDFLQYHGPQVDIVVGNPPYVRYDNLSQNHKNLYKQLFSTFRYRSDLYIPFYQQGLQLLKPGGKLSFICANRWLKNQYGRPLRELIAQAYTLEWNLNLEALQPFEENVSAYTSITQICKGPSVARPEIQLSQLSDLADLTIYHEPQGSFHLECDAVDIRTPFGQRLPPPQPPFPLALIEEQDFTIGIGVATGADKIFVGNKLCEELESEFLLPLALSKDVQGEKMAWSGHYVINPWDAQGQLHDLSHYPKAKAYLERHYETLSKRYIARKHPQRWFQLIDKIKPGLTHQPKILLADISHNRWVTIDTGQYYPHHNLYYITGPSLKALKLLACFLMSHFVREQLQELSPLMNGGYARWQSQHLRKLQVPMLKPLPDKLSKQLLQAYDQQQLEAIQTLTAQILLTKPQELNSNPQSMQNNYQDLWQ